MRCRRSDTEIKNSDSNHTNYNDSNTTNGNECRNAEDDFFVSKASGECTRNGVRGRIGVKDNGLGKYSKARLVRG